MGRVCSSLFDDYLIAVSECVTDSEKVAIRVRNCARDLLLDINPLIQRHQGLLVEVFALALDM
jgi:hypothetical protein